MAGGLWTLYDTFRLWEGDGTFDMDGDTFKVTLHTQNYTPNAGNQSVYADLTNELPTASGYTSGGLTLSSRTWTRTTAQVILAAADAVWTASGTLTAKYAVIRKSGTANGHVDPLVAYVDLETTVAAGVTATSGNPLTLKLTSILSKSGG